MSLNKNSLKWFLITEPLDKSFVRIWLLMKNIFSPFNSYLMASEGVSKGQGLFSSRLFPTRRGDGYSYWSYRQNYRLHGSLASLPRWHRCSDPAKLPTMPLTDVARHSQQLFPYILFFKKGKKNVDRRELRAWARLRQDSPKLFLLGGT